MIERGEIWWAALDKPVGSAPGYRRPVVIAQANAFNQSALSTVIVVGLTSNLDRANDPGNVLVHSNESGLEKHSVVNVTNVLTLDKALLERRIGALPAHLMERVEKGLRRILAL